MVCKKIDAIIEDLERIL